jgi:hypothetical protein
VGGAEVLEFELTMSKVPPILLSKLAELRRRERLLRFVWGAARVLALMLLALMLACTVDWLFDLWEETPFELRAGMLVGQAFLAAATAVLLIQLPVLVRLRDEALALFVEEKSPQLQHRLISALELNRPGAPIEGMSPELLGAMTREAAQQVSRIRFAALADHRRLRRGVVVLAPLVLLFLGLALLFPETVAALLQRQLLLDVDIPRTVQIASSTTEIWPSGEDVVLHFKATGPGLDAGATGTVRIRPDNQPSFTVPLTFESQQGDTAIFAAKVRPATVDFHYTARLGDGRTRQPSRVKYVSRPNIERQEGYLILPDYVGLRPDGKLYEQHQPTGDIKGMPDLSARIVIKTQKPIYRAILQTYGSPYPDVSGPAGLSKTHQDNVVRLTALSTVGMLALPDGGPLGAWGWTAQGELRQRRRGSVAIPSAFPEPTGQTPSVSVFGPTLASQMTIPLRKLEQYFQQGTQQVEWLIDLRPTETSYSVVVFDEYGFASKTKTVRALKIEPEPPPTVVLHSEWDRFAKLSNTTLVADFGGLPLPLLDGVAGKEPISYDAFGPYGIGKVQLKIGVFRGQSGSGERQRRGVLELWATLELEEWVASKRRPRPFDLSHGDFEDNLKKEKDKDQVEFYPVPVPAASASSQWPRTLAGGSFDYHVAGFVDVRTGQPFEFQVGDHVVIYIEVFNRNTKKPLMTRSPKAREKDLVSFEDFDRILIEVGQEMSRIKSLMYLQQQVYDRPWYSIFGFK